MMDNTSRPSHPVLIGHKTRRLLTSSTISQYLIVFIPCFVLAVFVYPLMKAGYGSSLQMLIIEQINESQKSPGMCAKDRSEAHIAILENIIQPSYEQLMIPALVDVQKGTWLQIGANTMDNKNRNDPLKLHLEQIPSWSKVFVEPVPYLHKLLTESIKRWPNSTAINVAISADEDVAEGQVDIYCLKESFDSVSMETELPHWANQICSFNPEHIPKHFPGNVGVPVKVTALSLVELLHRYAIQNVDVLMIDTEGFDYNVLKQLPFDRIRPILIVYEHKHLTTREQEEAKKLLRKHCYGIWTLDRENTAALALYV